MFYRSNPLLLQHWIYSKYARLEFSTSGLPSYLNGTLDGFLMKKMREDGRFLPRRFILENNTLCYFVENKTPKAVIKLEDLNVSLNPKKLGKEFCLQIDHLYSGSTRHLYVCHDDSNVIIQWYYALLAGKAVINEVSYYKERYSNYSLIGKKNSIKSRFICILIIVK